MENLKTKRAPLRAGFTKTYNLLKEKLQETEVVTEEMEMLLEQLLDKSKRLQAVDETILDALCKSKATEEEFNSEFEACEVYVEKLVELKSKVKHLLAVKEDPKRKVVLRNEEECGSDSSRQLYCGLKLPKINLIEFDGDPRNWLSFWACFQKIHEDKNLDEHSKFVYLLNCTKEKSKAREIVQSFPTTVENYPKVIDHLKSRFGREDNLIQLYIRDLLQLVLTNNNGNSTKTKDLSSLYDKLETKLRALESLGVTKDKYASIIFPLVESCLPADTLRIWEREREKANEGKENLDSLLDFLKNEVLSEERMLVARHSFGFEKPKKSAKNYGGDDFNVATCSDLWVGDKSRNSAPIKKREDFCLFCDKPHATEKCFKASELSYEDKKNLIFKKGACYVCLKRNHIARSCRNRVKCLICGNKRHVAVMCQCGALKPENGKAPDSAPEVENVMTNRVVNSDVLLQTLVVKLKNGNIEKSVRAILDTGSEKSYLAQDVLQYLKCDSVGERKLIHKLFGGIETKEKTHQVYKVNVNSLNNQFNCDIYCLDVPIICSDVKRIPKGPWLSELDKRGIRVTDTQRNAPLIDSEIKLLIGSDIAGKLFTGNIECLKSGPVAMETRLGWVLMGKISENKISEGNTCTCVSLLLNARSVENFWKLDIIGINDPAESKTKAELQQESMFYFTENLNVDPDGRYEIALPWVLDKSRLPSNRELAEKRLVSTKRKLLDLDRTATYQEVFDAWVGENIIERVIDRRETQVHYLPHRAVFKDSSQTTKVRPVFDASAHIKGFPSLNDCLEKGPNLIEIIPSLLNRFRRFEFGVVADIEKAFLQIGIREKDRDFLRFLWKEGSEGEVKIYRHRRVVFGLNCSPFLLVATLNYHLDKAPDHFSDTARILKESFYVDNCITSFRTVGELNEFVIKSKILLSSGKFHLREWQSNGESEIIPRTGLEESTYVLGLNWDLKRDTLSCKIESPIEDKISATKRTLLSCTHKLFDPIGFTSPVTLFPRLILQECWKLRLNWDEKLPEHLEKKFHKWVGKMHLLAEIQVPRWFYIGRAENEDISLHVFCDASKYAYATSIFLRVQTGEHVSVNFVQARARVAPLKNVTIPRLELLACSIGARLGNTVTTDLKIPELKLFYWCDSTTALTWIRRDVRWGTFVWNRVEEIRTLTKIEDWRHVRSELNAADLPSRGCSVEHFLQSRWWEGPSWLKAPETAWPCDIGEPDEDLVNAEKRKSVLAAHNADSKPGDWYYRYFSSYKQIVKMIAWILRFYYNSRSIKRDLSCVVSMDEFGNAEKVICKLIQQESFAGLTDPSIRSLRAITDDNGLIRIKTQVLYRQDTTNFRLPILLPSNHPVVHRLIFWKHTEFLHAGVSLLMTHLREDYWIIKARRTIRAVVQQCVRCKRFNAQRIESEPVALPTDRVQDAAVFQTVGVDLAGPLYLRDKQKAWIVLYTCAVYRAVHLELVTSLSTEAFLQSLRRFVARRGRPSTVYSDNGSNFVGADNAFSKIDWDKISASAAVQRIRWKFNPPTAAWWGGWWERLIQLVKRILRKVLGKASLTFEELITVLCDCEQVVNARPLTYVTENTDDLTPLTPAVFLQPLQSSEVTDIDLVDSHVLNRRLKYVQELREHLRKRFRIEYLGQLRQQMLNPKRVKSLSVNDVVLVESDQKRAQWVLARVIELVPGRDGRPRVAKLKTQTSELVRPVQRLYNLEVQGDLPCDPVVRTRSGRKVIPPERLQL